MEGITGAALPLFGVHNYSVPYGRSCSVWVIRASYLIVVAQLHLTV